MRTAAVPGLECRGEHSEEARCTDPPKRRAFSFLVTHGVATIRTMPKRVLLASPRGYCAGVERAVDTVERALELYGAARLRPQADRPQRPRRPRPRGARRDLRRERDGGARGRDGRLLGARRRAVGARERRGARAEHDRRDLPARDEGARPGAPLRRRGLHGHPDRPRGPRGGRGTMGEAPESTSSSSRSRTPRRSISRRTRKLAYITQTTLSVDETGEMITRSAAASPTSTRRRRRTSATRPPTASGP